jgi:hypothetical protein
MSKILRVRERPWRRGADSWLAIHWASGDQIRPLAEPLTPAAARSIIPKPEVVN